MYSLQITIKKYYYYYYYYYYHILLLRHYVRKRSERMALPQFDNTRQK